MYSQVSAQLESNCPMLKKQKCRSLSFWVTIRFIDVSVLLNKQNREINLEIISHFSPCALPLLNQDKHYRESIKTNWISSGKVIIPRNIYDFSLELFFMVKSWVGAGPLQVSGSPSPLGLEFGSGDQGLTINGLGKCTGLMAFHFTKFISYSWFNKLQCTLYPVRKSNLFKSYCKLVLVWRFKEIVSLFRGSLIIIKLGWMARMQTRLFVTFSRSSIYKTLTFWINIKFLPQNKSVTQFGGTFLLFVTRSYFRQRRPDREKLNMFI